MVSETIAKMQNKQRHNEKVCRLACLRLLQSVDGTENLDTDLKQCRERLIDTNTDFRYKKGCDEGKYHLTSSIGKLRVRAIEKKY